MKGFIESIYGFLEDNGFDCTATDICGRSIINVTLPGGEERTVLPLKSSAGSVTEAENLHNAAKECLAFLGRDVSITDSPIITTEHSEVIKPRPIIISEDRWHSQQQMMKSRLLAHLEVFDQIYARNCEVRKIDKNTAGNFLGKNHSYGDATCRYRYGLFLKRHTGHIAESSAAGRYSKGDLLAVATFSNARKWIKGGATIRSYEWTRYASMPGVRINGGMGKLLKAFIEDVNPDDIMTYADLEWSEGMVYEKLGFTAEGNKAPVTFAIDNKWKRIPLSKCPDIEHSLFFKNLGSLKYRLKLTEY